METRHTHEVGRGDDARGRDEGHGCDGMSSVTADGAAAKSKVDAEGELGIGLGSVSEPEWRDTKVTWVEPARP